MTTAHPHVLFVCVKNGGKSQMAAGLLRAAAHGTVGVSSAGTRPGTSLNAQSVDALLEVGVDIRDERPRALDRALVEDADLVVLLGREAHVTPHDATPVEVWDTDEPSERGIDGMDRMRLVRDDIATRVDDLLRRLVAERSAAPDA